jgi:competence protein ComEC
MKNWRKYLPYILIICLFLLSIFIWYQISSRSKESNILKVAFLDIGQGDSIYIEAPNGKQMLIDAGPNSQVLQKLGEVMPFADRSIDIILATHTDADHIGGFPSVISRYKVGKVIENGATSETRIYSDLQSQINKNKIDKIIARRGMRILLDKKYNIYFDILFPDRDITNLESNDGSIVGKLVYGKKSFILTGDASKFTENLIMHNENQDILNSQVLKLGHHGSHTSSSELFLEKVHPEVAIISASKNNRYGHPHQDVLGLLSKLHIPYLATYQKGTIMIETDGLELSY